MKKILFIIFVLTVSLLKGQNERNIEIIKPHGVFSDSLRFFAISDSLVAEEFYYSFAKSKYVYRMWKLLLDDSGDYSMKCIRPIPFKIDVVENCEYTNIPNTIRSNLDLNGLIQIEIYDAPWTISTCIYAIGVKVNNTVYKYNNKSFLIEIPQDSLSAYGSLSLVYLPSGFSSEVYYVKKDSSKSFLISIPDYDSKFDYLEPCLENTHPRYYSRYLKVISNDTISIYNNDNSYVKILARDSSENVLNWQKGIFGSVTNHMSPE